ncbi:transcriptional regulator [Halomicroarcula sp. S1AR25-4]|uniref:transcriptional regulator n=1 Tax=Haloarcula sp. S1AR25-4 TaxID=2950538 RepID=UPI0028754D15|nr:transcriptional regulator [Halomicroarcula sp. S1AR25-4]MDS0280367.1 transcriptional regulator [Halomicroarcula sp. S1AR25-4]
MNDHKNDAGDLCDNRESSGSNLQEQADGVRSLLELITQETRFTLIQNIVAHPKGMPSLKELVYANPSKSKSTIRNHLEKLVDADVVETVALPQDERQRDLPHKFYRLSTSGEKFLEKHDLLRAQDTLQEMHAMLEKTPQIQKYIDAPRPGDDGDEKSDESRRTLKP